MAKILKTVGSGKDSQKLEHLPSSKDVALAHKSKALKLFHILTEIIALTRTNKQFLTKIPVPNVSVL